MAETQYIYLAVSKSGPVFITDRGKPAHVLLSFAEYQRLTQQRRNIADALAMPVGAVATRNVADFAATGVEIITPWEFASPLITEVMLSKK